MQMKKRWAWSLRAGEDASGPAVSFGSAENYSPLPVPSRPAHEAVTKSVPSRCPGALSEGGKSRAVVLGGGARRRGGPKLAVARVTWGAGGQQSLVPPGSPAQLWVGNRLANSTKALGHC